VHDGGAIFHGALDDGMMALITAFSRFPSARLAAETRFDSLFSVDILLVVECMRPSNVCDLRM
jgi:hypothetical protein